MPLLLPTYIHPRTRARLPNAYLEVEPPVFRVPAAEADITYRIWGSDVAKQEGGVPVFEETVTVKGAQYQALVTRITTTLENQIKVRLFPDAVIV